MKPNDGESSSSNTVQLISRRSFLKDGVRTLVAAGTLLDPTLKTATRVAQAVSPEAQRIKDVSEIEDSVLQFAVDYSEFFPPPHPSRPSFEDVKQVPNQARTSPPMKLNMGGARDRRVYINSASPAFSELAGEYHKRDRVAYGYLLSALSNIHEERPPIYNVSTDLGKKIRRGLIEIGPYGLGSNPSERYMEIVNHAVVTLLIDNYFEQYLHEPPALDLTFYTTHYEEDSINQMVAIRKFIASRVPDTNAGLWGGYFYQCFFYSSISDLAYLLTGNNNVASIEELDQIMQKIVLVSRDPDLVDKTIKEFNTTHPRIIIHSDNEESEPSPSEPDPYGHNA